MEVIVDLRTPDLNDREISAALPGDLAYCEYGIRSAFSLRASGTPLCFALCPRHLRGASVEVSEYLNRNPGETVFSYLTKFNEREPRKRFDCGESKYCR